MSFIHISKDDLDIDLSYVKSYFFRRLNYFVISVALALVTALAILFLSDEKYTSEVAMHVEVDSDKGTKGGFLQGLGMSLMGGSGASLSGTEISSYMRDNLLHHYPFLHCVAHTPLVGTGNDDQISTLYQHFSEKDHIKKISDTDSIDVLWNVRYSPQGFRRRMARKDLSIYDEISNCVEIESAAVSSESTAISFVSASPHIAFGALSSVVDCVSNFVVEYHTIREQNSLNYVEKNFFAAKKSYEEAQESLAVHQDRNINTMSKRAKMEVDRLKAELQLKKGVYLSLGSEYQASKVRLEKKKPVITILRPTTVPSKPSHPRKTFVLVVSILLGVVATALFVFGEMTYFLFRKEKSNG